MIPSSGNRGEEGGGKKTRGRAETASDLLSVLLPREKKKEGKNSITDSAGCQGRKGKGREDVQARGHGSAMT